MIYNKRTGYPAGAVLIDRTTKFGNPFIIGKDGTRGEVIQKFEQYLCTNAELMEAVKGLKGKDLVCWCAPLACHGDVIEKYANANSLPFK
jgi:hypothetical protein